MRCLQIPTREARAAIGVSIPVHELNMCGSFCGPSNNVNSLPAADLVVYLVAVANPKPWFVMTNEVCQAHIDRMSASMASMGYSQVKSVTETNVTGVCGGDFGNVMWVLGQPRGSGPPENIEVQYPTPSGCNIASGDQCRKIECMRTNTFIGVVTGCNTHLISPRNSANTTQESNEALYIVNVNFANDGRFVGGDFNHTLLLNWAGGYYEIDTLNRPTFEVPSPTFKIDYIWADISHWPATRSAAPPYCNHGYDFSDHCYLSGTWSV
jgi:hypothetical protein